MRLDEIDGKYRSMSDLDLRTRFEPEAADDAARLRQMDKIANTEKYAVYYDTQNYSYFGFRDVSKSDKQLRSQSFYKYREYCKKHNYQYQVFATFSGNFKIVSKQEYEALKGKASSFMELWRR